MKPTDEGASRILCFATHGDDHLDARRLRYLLEPLAPEFYPFSYARKRASALGLLRSARARRPSLIVMEGTGFAGGIALLLLRGLLGIPYVVSSGDAIGPYLSRRSRLTGLLGGLYERLLCRYCAGFIGWTPYLVGRALTFGAPRAMTAPGWARESGSGHARERIRAELAIPRDAIVLGIVGSLDWSDSVGYAYGLELVKAIPRLQRRDVVACIVGDGSGKARLEALAGSDLGSRIFLTGRVEPSAVADYLAAFDMASVPQSVDTVGSFRYSTKLSECLAAGLPIITGQIPAAYDLDAGYIHRLPGPAPWAPSYIDALVEFLEGVTGAELTELKRAASTQDLDAFDKHAQQARACAFLSDILLGAG
jgi:glycosyltransferase involved in cell wall biosynthesis